MLHCLFDICTPPDNYNMNETEINRIGTLDKCTTRRLVLEFNPSNFHSCPLLFGDLHQLGVSDLTFREV